MNATFDYIQDYAQGFSDYVAKTYPGLTLKYILHHRGQRNDAVELERSFFDMHPAGITARNILKKSKSTQKSAFHSLAIETKRSFFGLKKTREAIAPITINIDDYGTNEAALADIYHYGVHAIEAFEMVMSPSQRGKVSDGPLVPKRSPLSMAKVNMVADIFSVLILAHQGHDTMIKSLAAERGLDTLLAKSNSRPWLYPYTLAYETAQSLWDNFSEKEKAEFDPVATPLELARAVRDSFEQESFTQWWSFCKPAQEMAWNGELPEHILCACLHTDDNPLVKAIGYLLQDCLDIVCPNATAIEGRFNAFMKEEERKDAHFTKIEETFEMVLAEGLMRESSRPFMEAANIQNARLPEGRVFGWCAAALQAAGNAFEKALKGGGDPSQYAKLEFQGTQKDMGYDTLQKISQEVIKRRQAGETLSLEDVKGFSASGKGGDMLGRSIEKTISDPSYQKTLDNAHTPKPVPVAAPQEPQAAPRVAPVVAPHAAPAALPGGMTGGGPVTTTQPPAQKQPEKEENEEGNKEKAGS